MQDGNSVPELELADWRRRVAKLYADVRFLRVDDPVAAWQLWRSEREALYREHSQSPVMVAARAAFKARHWGYDPRLAFELAVEPDEPAVSTESAASAPALGSGVNAIGLTMAGHVGPVTPIAIEGASDASSSGSLALPTSGGGTMAFRRIGWLDVPFPAGSRRLAVYWMAGYAGGLFLPFRDATNGAETYGAGRYLLDGCTSADLGGAAIRS